MPYLRRYAICTTRNGATAYDLYDTMNRQAYFRDNGNFRFDAATLNIDSLQKVRNGEAVLMDSAFYDVTPLAGELIRFGVDKWFAHHGVRVEMATYDEQEWEFQAAEAAADAEAAVEDAHLLYNLFDNGTVGSFDTDDMTLSDSEDDQDVIDLTRDDDDLISLGSVASEISRFRNRL